MSTCRMMRSWLVLGLIVNAGGLAAIAVPPPPPPPDGDPYASLLAKHSISSEADGIVAYLRSVRPDAEGRKRVAALIAQLGHDSFARRERATRQLIELPVVCVEALRAAAETEGGEARLRAQQVLAARSAGNANSAVAVACFRTIAKRKLLGAASVLLEVLPLYAEEFAQVAGREALRATCRPEDAELIRRAARDGALEARVAAI